jgi:hypothetical protein
MHGLTNLKFIDALLSQIYLWKKTLHVSESSFVHHQEVFTVHTTLVYVIMYLLTAWEQAVSKPTN